VIDFEKLVGKEALWKMALFSKNEKAKELSQELLVSLHLRFDNTTASKEQKEAVIVSFVQNCMVLLTRGSDAEASQLIETGAAAAAGHTVSDEDKKSVTQLLSLFLDRYEGIKVLKPELVSLARMSSIKPFEVDIINNMDPENRTIQRILISYFQTIGHLREKIAREFGLQINDFNLMIKQNFVDPDIDDDRYLKDINGLPSKFTIEKNIFYDAALHPKFLLSNNQENFSVIFSMLKASSPTLCEPVWALISKLPVNEHVIESLKTLSSIKSSAANPASPLAATMTSAAVAAAWKNLLDS